MGDDAECGRFLTQVRKACRIGQKLRDLKIRRYGIIRIDSAASVEEWAKDPETNTKRIATTFREACSIAESFGERLAAEGEICWAGMHSWRRNVQLLEMVGRPGDARLSGRHGAHHVVHHGIQRGRKTACSPMASIGPTRTTARRIVSPDGQRAEALDDRFPRGAERWHGQGLRLPRPRPAATASRPIPTGSSTLSATPARGCAATTDNRRAPFRHICWDGCMFPNSVMLDPKTWQDILRVMIAVRNAHGWANSATPPPRLAVNGHEDNSTSVWSAMGSWDGPIPTPSRR